MYQDFKKIILACLVYQKAKIEHQKPVGLLQPQSVPEWKWDNIAMDFVVGFPWTTKRFDTIQVIIDRLTECDHFLPINESYALEMLSQI